MAVEITLAQFNKIAIGDYNAGFVDFKTDGMLHVHKYNWMERLDAETVLEALDKLADTANARRKIIADYIPGADAADADLPVRLGDSGIMQV